MLTPATPARRLLVAGAAGLLGVLLVLPLGLRAAAGATALRFLAEFLTEGARPWLSAGTPAPVRQLRMLARAPADLWRPPGRGPFPGLLLVHGLTPAGKDDPRLVAAARLLARAGFAVLVPTLPALQAQRLRPDDGAVVGEALRVLAAEPAVRGDPVLLAVSVGAGPALAAAADPAAPPLRLVLLLGGYAEARELVRYFTTGAYGFGGDRGRVPQDPALARAFVQANLDLVRDPAERAAVALALQGAPLPPTAGSEARAVLALLANRDPDRVDALLEALPAETRALLDALSPARHVGRLRARLILVHGRQDPAIPFTESLRLAAAADPRRVRLVVADLLVHVEGQAAVGRQVRELARLWSVLYELFRG